jgi:ribosome-associated protein
MKSAERKPSPARRTRRLPAAIAAAVEAARDKKATDLVVLDLRRSSAFTDFFLLCTGQSTRQVKAITDAIEARLRTARRAPSHLEGYERAEWVLMDYFDFVVHVFTPETRAFYALDRLWGQAERIELPAVPERVRGGATG